MVGNDQTRFPWIDEALTDYSVAIYKGFVDGEAGYQEVINNYAETYTAYERNNRSDIIGQSPLAYTVEAYSAIVYRKGAVFFHTLSQVLGGQVFLTALQNYLLDFRYRVATPDDLQNAFETASGSQLDNLFMQWVGYSN
jgi:aminopeptidase N